MRSSVLDLVAPGRLISWKIPPPESATRTAIFKIQKNAAIGFPNGFATCPLVPLLRTSRTPLRSLRPLWCGFIVPIVPIVLIASS